MPEYLAPGVYIEEIDTGPQPIEGVSTSITGMLGVTERGPVDVPILITSYGEFTYWFGGRLNKEDFSNALGSHCYLPHAVEGFFTNGGQLLYITRILDSDGAQYAQAQLFDRGSDSSPQTLLLRAAGELTGTAVNPPLLYVVDSEGLKKDAWIRVGDGSRAEYLQLADDPGTPSTTTHVPLDFTLTHSHAAGTTVQQITVAAGKTFTLVFADPSQQSTLPGDQLLTLSTTTQSDLTGLQGQVLKIIGDSSHPDRANEYRFVMNVPSAVFNSQTSAYEASVLLDSGLQMSYPAGITVNSVTPTPVVTATLDLDASMGDGVIFLHNIAPQFQAVDNFILLDPGNSGIQEVRRIGTLSQLGLVTASYEIYNPGSLVEVVQLTDDAQPIADPAPKKGDNVISVDDVSELQVGQKIKINGASADTVTIQAITTLSPPNGKKGRVMFMPDLLNDHKMGDQLDNMTTSTANVSFVTLDDRTGAVGDPAPPQSGDTTITLDDITGLSAGETLLVGTAANQESMIIRSTTPLSDTTTRGRVTFTRPLAHSHNINDLTNDPVALTARSLTSAVIAGGSMIALDNRLGLAAGDVLRVDVPPNQEFVTIKAVPNRASAGPDSGNVILTQPLDLPHANKALVWRERISTTGVTQKPSTTVLITPAGANTLVVADGENYTQSTRIRLTTPGDDVFYHELAEDAITESGGKLHPASVTLTNPFERAHAAGTEAVGRTPLLAVRALDKGAWGDRLRLSVADETTGLVSRTTLIDAANSTHIRLASPTGVESGTVLELLDPDTNTVIGSPIKVESIDRATNYTIVLQAANALSLTQLGLAKSGITANKPLVVRSREFSLTVLLLRQPDPALPSRDEIVMGTEIFHNLSMDPRHSHYIQTVIGDGDPSAPLRLSDRRPEGASWYIRVTDLAPDQVTEESIRLGPEPLVDVLPSGRIRPARQALEQGDDSIPTLSDDVYIGNDADEPLDRTGLQTFRNVNEISIVACPGRTTTAIQGALIDHCELMLYRFAVLDAPSPPFDTLTDVQTLRQQFDTKYAAIYHPWLLIPDPFPTNLSSIADYPIAPSGHVTGVYARTDIDRGVYKAPANEVVLGIQGLQRVLNKAEQEILNPFPSNINVIRDFRHDNRGIRVYGARVITSDPDWKYVNVRRLLIFIEASLDSGLQWVVFEPNAEPLWARVRGAIKSFLTDAWRSGALEGTTAAEAFFVKCDRSTMTQDDIDNGRLICVVGVAPVKPAEFVIVRIGLFTAQATT